jgi:hypothetical protein
MRAALLIAVLVASVGCGAGQTASGAESTTTEASGTSLQMSVWSEGRGSGPPDKWVLRCDPVGGTLLRRAAACRQLATMKQPFAPLRKDLVCTDQYGGPHEALIAGTHRGSRIWVILTLRNGCEISRAKRLGFLVPGMAAGASGS